MWRGRHKSPLGRELMDGNRSISKKMYGGAHDFFSAIFKHSSSSIFNVEFNYVEHLNKQYLTPNYSAPWKPSANKLAMLMWERDLIFLTACMHKSRSRGHPHPACYQFWAIVDWWIKQGGFDLRAIKEISGVNPPARPHIRVLFRLRSVFSLLPEASRS